MCEAVANPALTISPSLAGYEAIASFAQIIANFRHTSYISLSKSTGCATVASFAHTIANFPHTSYISLAKRTGCATVASFAHTIANFLHTNYTSLAKSTGCATVASIAPKSVLSLAPNNTGRTSFCKPANCWVRISALTGSCGRGVFGLLCEWWLFDKSTRIAQDGLRASRCLAAP